MPFEPSPHRDEIIQQLREGIPVDEVAKRFPVSRRTVERYDKALKEGKLDQPEKPLKEREGGKLATFTAKQPAPVVFFLGEQRIELEPQAIYESYLLYEDLRAKVGLNDSFSQALQDAMGIAWRLLAAKPIIEGEKFKILEVNHGGDTGQGD